MPMVPGGFQFSRFAILMHPSIARACEQAEVLQSFLLERGASEAICSDIHDEAVLGRIQRGEFDLLIPLGGDGTALRAARLGAPAGIPILGINLGRSGFLMEMGPGNWKDYLPHIFSGKFRLENRMLLLAEHWRGNKKLGEWDVVNEVVVCRGQYVRPINLAATVDGFPLANYLADGLIVATPTGSTAYSLAVGGPILPPDLRNILIVPVAPHLSLERAVVLAESAEVDVRVQSRHEAVLSLDGQAGILMENDDYIHVKVNPLSVDFVRFQDKGAFYRNLTCSMERNSCPG
jgi:NAD+ kinase